MSDRDPLEQLARLGSGGPVTPLPPAEVRRLGDRRRARRTAVTGVAGAVAVLAVVIPASLYAARDDGVTPTPPSSSDTASAAVIPNDFPLDHGFAALKGDTAGPTHGDLGITPLDLCGDVGWVHPSDRLGTWFSSDNLSQWRELAMFPDTDAAVGAVAHFREAVQVCPTETFTDRDGSRSVVHIDARTSPVAGDTVAWRRSDKDGVMESATAIRVGRAVLYVAAGGPSPSGDADRTVDTAVGWLSGQMCSLPGADCLDPNRPASDRIADDFPLGLGAQDYRAEGHFEGPGRDVSGTTPTPCNADPLASKPAVDRLGFADIAIEFEDYRHLSLYADEADARAVMKAAADAVAACATEAFDDMTLTWVTRTADTGYESLTVSQGVRDAIGGTTFQLTRVGRAVLMVAFSGEGVADPSELTPITKQIAPHMCVFTAEGCGPNASSTPTATTPADCTAADLDTTVKPLDSAAGSTYAEVRFTNTSSHDCSIHGSSTLRAVTSDGLAIAGNTTTSNEFVLGHGGIATAMVKNTNPDNFPAADCKPAPVTAWRITVPGSGDRIDVDPAGYPTACTKIGNVSIDPWQAGAH